METTLHPMDNALMPRHEFFRLVGTSIGAILLSRCMAGCAGMENPDPTPDPSQKVDFILHLDDKLNANLLVKGGYVTSNGVIVAQTKDGKYVAVSANCTHQGTELTYKSVENQFYCPLHLSRFDTTGKVIVGPATLPLTQYTVEPNLAAGTIRVHN
ncbi:MAG: Rieske (2Fe-2S) protein [Cytophagaceae bacterium]|nr:MAG: Rieske (2Fe-2S) protein [Cytophagaceae bacterium]